METAKIKKISAIAVGAVILILGLLWYFQEQGFLKVFPTSEDRRVKKLLVIDESKFHPAEGLAQETFQENIKKLYDLRAQVLENRENSKLWFDFGYQKEFLNDHEGAAGAWEQAYSLQPENFVVAFNLGNVFQYFLKDYGRAEFYYQKALEIQPRYTSAYQGLADLYRFNWKEKQGELEPLLLKAMKNDEVNQATYLSLLVEFFAGSGDLATAKDYLAKLKGVNPVAAQDLLQNYPQL